MFKYVLSTLLAMTVFTMGTAVMAQNAPLPMVTKAPSQATPDFTTGLGSPDDNEHVEAYSGLDIASHGWIYGWVEGTVAPITNTDTSGLRLRLYGEAGQDQYQSETFEGLTNRENWYRGDALVGYAFEQEHFSAELYLGASVIDYVLRNPDPENPVQGTKVGPVVAGEFESTYNRALISGEASYTTAFNTYYTKLKLGWEVANQIFIGPETGIDGDQRFNQWRVGVHVTALNVGNARIAIGGGYEHDTDTGPGAYSTIEAGIEF
jgi:Cellulose biosynthesis protein BcsS